MSASAMIVHLLLEQLRVIRCRASLSCGGDGGPGAGLCLHADSGRIMAFSITSICFMP
jgi:hypothetical protein